MWNRRPNGSVQVRHVRRDSRDRNPRGDSMRNPRTNQGRRSSLAVRGDLRPPTHVQFYLQF
jgi:hypothetical protein